MVEIERHAKPVKEISMVPLINVVFLLLIFFLVAGSLEKFHVLQVEPPIAESGQEINQGPIVIVLGKYNEILLDDELVERGQMIEMLKERLEKNPKRLITIKADARMKAVGLVDILDEIKEAGGINLSILTQSL